MKGFTPLKLPPQKKKESRWTTVIWVGVITLVLMGVVLIFLYPYRPADLVGWLLLLFVGVPVFIGLELLSETAGGPLLGWIDNIRNQTLKIFVAVLVALVVMGILLGVLFWLTSSPGFGSIEEFFSRHFEEW